MHVVISVEKERITQVDSGFDIFKCARDIACDEWFVYHCEVPFSASDGCVDGESTFIFDLEQTLPIWLVGQIPSPSNHC